MVLHILSFGLLDAPFKGNWKLCGNDTTGIYHITTKYHYGKGAKKKENIARGTTDPEIDSVTWIELGNNMAPLTLVANLTT